MRGYYTGYLWSCEIYIGKANPVEKKLPAALEKSSGKTGSIVVRLIHQLLEQGYKLFVDNWYTSKKLFRYLAENETGACGTVKG